MYSLFLSLSCVCYIALYLNIRLWYVCVLFVTPANTVDVT